MHGCRVGLIVALVTACVGVAGCNEPPRLAPQQALAATGLPAEPLHASDAGDAGADPAPPGLAVELDDTRVPAAPAAATRPFAFDAPPAGQQAPAPCAFPALAGGGPFKLFAAGAYQGRALGFAIDRSGHGGTAVDVLVNAPGERVALMLGNYEPTVWNIGWSQGTQIAAVLIGGYHSQHVTGLPADVPLLVSTHDNRGSCGYFYVSEQPSTGLNPLARRVFGKPIDMLHPVRDGKVVVGAALQPGVALLTDASARPLTGFRLADALAGGRDGLAHAVRQGWLRPATQADADAWVAARDAAVRADLPPVAGGRPPARLGIHNAYVVLKPFELPPGLYGAHLATFFVPRGIARPSGNPGHSAIYDFNTLGCTGASCSRGE